MNFIRRHGGIDHFDPLRFLPGQEQVTLAYLFMEGPCLFFKTGFLLGFFAVIDPLPGPGKAGGYGQVKKESLIRPERAQNLRS